MQRFDGTQWKGLATADSTGDVFALQNRTPDLKVDASGRVWLVTGTPTFGGSALVRRFNAATLAWETIGGALPQATTSGLTTPRLRFDATGQPVIAWQAAVGTGGISNPGVAVYRYDGSVWSTTGGFRAGGNQASAGPNDLGFAIADGDAVVSWTSSLPPFLIGVVIQRNTSSGWSPVGSGLGQVVEFVQGVANDQVSSGSKLVTIGTDLYLVLVASPASAFLTQARVVLLRRVPN